MDIVKPHNGLERDVEVYVGSMGHVGSVGHGDPIRMIVYFVNGVYLYYYFQRYLTTKSTNVLSTPPPGEGGGE